MRYYLVDRIEKIKKFSCAEGVRCISLSDEVFKDHFPGEPVYPGALQIEIMAQLGGALLEASFMKSDQPLPRCVLSSVKAKFRGFVRPGDRIALRADVISLHEDSAMISVVGTVDGRKTCEATIIYILLNVENPVLDSSRREYIQFLTQSAQWEE